MLFPDMLLLRKSFPEIVERLLHWYHDKCRPLPWRREHLPYQILISEIMLQQTQVQTALPYYERWMARFPDFHAVSAASEDEVLKMWEGLGYYSRARNIHKLSQIIVRDFGGHIPVDHKFLLSLPGIGPYTAGAIMSFAFNADFPVVDGNVERVFARLFNIDAPVKEGLGKKMVWKIASEILPQGRARHFNQAIMDLGALVCLPRSWNCDSCPVRPCCRSADLGLVEHRPVPPVRKKARPLAVSVGILQRGDEVFIQKRPPGGLMPHLWEFPGGKIEAGESPDEALLREFQEELGASICRLDRIGVFRHSYTAFRVTLHVYFCELKDPSQEPLPVVAVDSRWVHPHELQRYAFPAANRRLIGLLL
jgi:A/G-specific adenine glycosylase